MLKKGDKEVKVKRMKALLVFSRDEILFVTCKTWRKIFFILK